MQQWIRGGVLGLLALACLGGCGSKNGTVTGEVTYENEPIGEGYITFTPTDGQGTDAGGPITNGKYSVEKVPPGPKIVKIIATKKVNFASTSEEMQQKAAAAQRRGNYDGLVDPADTIPENAEGNHAKIDIKDGANKHNFALKRPR